MNPVVNNAVAVCPAALRSLSLLSPLAGLGLNSKHVCKRVCD